MDINIFIALLIYLFLFNENKIIKRLLLIYLIIYIFSNLYKCFFKKVIEGSDNIGEPIDYNKNIYNILNDNILLLQDVNSLKQYEKKLKEDITTIQNNLKTNVDTLKVNIDKKHNIGDDINFKSKNINNKGYISATDNGLSLDFKAPESNKIFKLKDIPTNPNDIVNKSYVDGNTINKYWFTISGSYIQFDDYYILIGNRYPYLALRVGGDRSIFWSSTLNYAKQGGGYYGQALNRTVNSSSGPNHSNLSSHPLDTIGRHVVGQFYDASAGKYFRFSIMVMSVDSTYLFHVERLN